METLPVYLTQSLALPKGLVKSVVPKLVWQNKVYAYEVNFEVGRPGSLSIDARQLPVDVPQLQGQYGEVGLLATALTATITHQSSVSSWAAQYLGEQLSLVFFQDLLSRYNKLVTESAKPNQEQAEDDGIAQFQDDYAHTLEDYTPQGFFLGDYESAPMLRFSWGTVLLSPMAHDQLQNVAKPGEWVDVQVSEWSLGCFKALTHPN